MANVYGPKIVRNGLVLYLDKYNERSYLGEPTTNNRADISDWTVGANGSTSQGTVTFSSDGYLATVVNNSQSVRLSSSLTVTANATMTHSFKFRWLSEDLAWNSLYYYMYTTGHGSHSIWATGSGSMNLTSSSEWQTVEHTWTMTGGSTLMNFYIGAQDNVAFTNSFEIKDVQIEEKVRATKWVDGTRSATNGWQDLTGNGNHADLTALTYIATNVPGANTNDFSFDGADDIVNLGSPSGLDNIFVGGGTISAWIKPESEGESYGRILDKSQNTWLGWIFYVYAGSGGTVGIQFLSYWGESNQRSVELANTIPTGEWSHVALTYNSGSTSNVPILYLNGLSVGSSGNTPTGTVTDDSSKDITLGNMYQLNKTWDGEIETVKFYNRVLSATEVLQNFNAHKGRYGL